MAVYFLRIVAILLAVSLIDASVDASMARQRPVDPWVYAGSLDDHARVLFVALDRSLWVAYDTERGDVYKAWPGAMRNPEGELASFVTASTTLDAPLFLSNSGDTAWRIIRNGSVSVPDVRFRGYRLFGEQLTLMYTLITDYGQEVLVEEIPEVVFREDGRPGLQRVFYVEGLPPGFQLALDLEARTLKEKDDLVTDGILQRSGGRASTYVWGNTYDVLGRLILHDQRTTTLTIYFAPAILKNLQDIAQLEPTHLFKNTRAFQSMAGQSGGGRLARRSDHEPGASLKMYGIGESIDKLFPIAPGQLPSAHTVVSSIDLKNKQQFGGLDFYFITHIEAYLNIASAGDYAFKIEADDGFRLSIADSVLLEHDGLQAASLSEEVVVRLNPGVHPIYIEHFQSTGPKQLTLYWKPPWQSHFEVVREPLISTVKEEERRTSPGKKRVLRALPNEGIDVDRVIPAGRHPGLEIDTFGVAELRGLVGGMDVLSNGDVVFSLWNDGMGSVHVLENIGRSRNRRNVRKFADGLNFPLGITVVDDEVFALQKQELTHLIDNDGNGVTDEYHTVANAWHLTTDYQELSFGLAYHEGAFYAGLGIPINRDGSILIEELPERGDLVRIGFDGQVTPIVRGLHLPNGLAFSDRGELAISDQRNPWFSDSRLLFWQPIAAEPGQLAVASVADPLPLSSLWFPPGKGTQMPTQPLKVAGGPYAGHWLVGDLEGASLMRVAIDSVAGSIQGGVFRFSPGLSAPLNRFTVLNDSTVLTAGMPFEQTWLQPDADRVLFQRISFTDDTAFEMKSIHAVEGGFEIEFTAPVADNASELSDKFRLFSWPNSETHRRLRDEDHVEPLVVEQADLLEDGYRVKLHVSGLNPSTVVYIVADPGLKSQNGESLWTNEAWYSMNVLPR